MMKRILIILLFGCAVLRLYAQDNPAEKPSTLVFHVFYNDFNTAQLIRTTSLNNVFNNNFWSRIGDMQMGFGLNYLKGISSHIDFVSSLDGSSTDYLFKDGTYYGSNRFLLDINAGLNIKLLTDRHAVVPYLSAGGGVSFYQGKTGFYIPVGIGFQFNLFSQAFVFTNMQYRRALTARVNDNFQYNIGIGVSIGKKKMAKPVVVLPIIPVKVSKPDTARTAIKIPAKNILVSVTDLQTGLPLPGVLVVLSSADSNLTGTSDAGGKLDFNDIKAGDYTVSGILNGINTTTQQIAKNSFDTPREELKISITHNDPRFTLAGSVVNKSAGRPESGVTVSIVNTTQIGTDSTQSKPDGAFNIQLKAASNFIVSGKKAGYISNIEQLSTSGLNRSTTLYVKLELGIEEAGLDKTITLSNIYYDTGSAKIKPEASSDLEKLIQFLKDNASVKIEIDSHTDSRGNAKKNLLLSQARAQTVVDYLVKKGISKDRLIPKGYGATKLVNGCKIGVKCTQAQQELNRRTEFKVLNN